MTLALIKQIECVKIMIKQFLRGATLLLALFLPTLAQAASGPLAEGFGRESWLGKIHVVAVVVSLVLLASGILIFAILRTEGDDEEADDA